MKSSVCLRWLAISLWAVSTLSAATLNYSLNFNSLPSAQGWVYNTPYSGIPEATFYAATGTSLVESGVGKGLGPYSGFGWYSYAPTGYDPAVAWSLNFTARITDDEYWGPLYRHGFANYIFLGGYGFGFGVDRNNINLWDGTNIAVNVGTGFHDYSFSGDPTSHVYQIRMDGNLIATGPMAAGADQWFLGDVTNNHNANAELTSWEFTQAPEPSTALMMLAGAALVALRRKSVKPTV